MNRLGAAGRFWGSGARAASRGRFAKQPPSSSLPRGASSIVEVRRRLQTKGTETCLRKNESLRDMLPRKPIFLMDVEKLCRPGEVASTDLEGIVLVVT